MADIQRKLVKWGKRNGISRRFHAKDDKEMIATWRLDLNKILQIFNACSVARAMVIANFPLLEGARNKRGYNHFHRSSGCHKHIYTRFWRPESRRGHPRRRFRQPS